MALTVACSADPIPAWPKKNSPQDHHDDKTEVSSHTNTPPRDKNRVNNFAHRRSPDVTRLMKKDKNQII